MTRKGTIWLLILIIPFRVLLLLCNLKMTDFRFDHSFLHVVPQSIRTQAKHSSRTLIVCHIRRKSKTHFRNIGLYNTVLAFYMNDVRPYL